METSITSPDHTRYHEHLPDFRVVVDSPAQDQIRAMTAADPAISAYRKNAAPNLVQEVAALQAGIQAVRSVIRFDEAAAPPWRQPTVDRATCSGFAWATADMAAGLGVRPLLAHCNGHVLSVLQGRTGAVHVVNTDDLPHAWLFDAASVDNAYFIATSDRERITAVNDLQAQTLRVIPRRFAAVAERERLSTGNTQVSVKQWMEISHRVGMTVMTPWYAQQALQNRLELSAANARGDIYATAGALRKLARHNYDRESNPAINGNFKHFLRNVRQWVRDPAVHEHQIGAVLDGYEQLLDDSEIKWLELGDRWRYLAAERRSTTALSRARHAYMTAAGYRGIGARIQGKLRKVTELDNEFRHQSITHLTDLTEVEAAS